MEGAKNLRHSHFLSCPLTRGVFLATRNLPFVFPLFGVVFSIWVLNYFVLLVIYLFSELKYKLH